MTIFHFVHNKLTELRDEAYRNFHAKLIPNISKERIIGVRVPALRKLAKELAKRDDLEDFLNDLPHSYYEENNLHAFIIDDISVYDQCVTELDRFLLNIWRWLQILGRMLTISR